MTVIDTGYTKADAISGPARVLYAPTSVALPTKIDDIINLVADIDGNYDPKVGWIDFGLAADASSYSRAFETEGQEYEQPLGALFEKITQITREMTVNIAAFNPAALSIIEEAPASTAVAAAVNRSAQTRVDFGSFDSQTKYRIAMIQQRDKDAVLVTEGAGGPTRGGVIAHVLYAAAVTSDEVSFDISKGDPTAADVTFTASSDDAAVQGKDYGFHIFESAGVIAIV